MSKLTSFYEELLKLSGITVGDYGRLYVDDVAEPIYLKYDDRFIIFPEKQFLQSPENPSEKSIVFHPLSESTIRGMSEVQDILRRAAILHVNKVGRALLTKAVEINRNITADTSFKPSHKLSKLFANVGDVDEKFIKWWSKIEDKMSTDGKCRLFDIYLKQHGEHDGKRFDRICNISSPLHDAMTFNTDQRIFDIAVDRKKDINTLREILKALFPRLETGGYIVGSSSSVAPYLCAYLEGLVNIETQFNDVLLAYGKEANDTEGLHCKGLDLMRDVDLKALRNLLPADKPYNIGVTKDREEEIGNPNEKRRKSKESQTDERKETDVRQPREMTQNLQMETRKETTSEQPSTERKSDDKIPFWLTSDYDDRRGRGRSDDRRDYMDSSRDGDRRNDDRRGRYDDRGRGRYSDRDSGRDSGRYGRGRDSDRGGRYSDRGSRYDDRGSDRGRYDDRGGRGGDQRSKWGY